MDILTALADTAPAKSNRKCKVQRWLDEIPADTPGLEELVATITATDTDSAAYRTLQQLDSIVYKLGLSTRPEAIGSHRGKRCRCFT